MSRRVLLDDVDVMVPTGVYAPTTDTALLSEAARREHVADGGAVLDLCTGSGALAVALGGRARRLLAVDRCERAVRTARTNIARAGLQGDRVRVRQGDLFDALVGFERFDLITVNPPYLPELPDDGRAPGAGDRRVDAGPRGRDLLDRLGAGFARHLRPGGVGLVVQSEIADVDATLDDLREHGLSAAVAAEHRGGWGPRAAPRLAAWQRAGLPLGDEAVERLVVVRAEQPVHDD